MKSSIDFYKRTELICQAIPYGKVATYGQIALLCGFPTHSRQVGYALNKKLTNVSAHRVVNSQGYLTGSPAFQTPDTQKNMLKKEGVEVIDGKKVDLKKHQWKHTLDDALYFRELFHKNRI